MSGIKNSWKYEKDLLIIFNIKFKFGTIRKQGNFLLEIQVIYKKKRIQIPDISVLISFKVTILKS